MKNGLRVAVAFTALLLPGVCFGVSAEGVGSEWQAQYMDLLMNIADYYEEGAELIGYLADLNNDATPELVVLNSIGGGIMVGSPRVYYLTADGLGYTDVLDAVDAYDAAVYYDASTGEEVFLMDARGMEWTALGEEITEMSGRDCVKIAFDGSMAWAVPVEKFSDCIGMSCSQEIYDQYQTLKANYRLSDTSGAQVLTENVQIGITPGGSEFTDFISRYQYCGTIESASGGTEINEFLNLLGKGSDEVEAIMGSGETTVDGEMREYMAELYGYDGVAYCDFSGEILQTLSWECTLDAQEAYNEQILDRMMNELDQTMTPTSATDETDDMPGEYIWEQDRCQVSLTFKRYENLEMISVQMYRTEQMAEFGVDSDWQSVYRMLLYSPEKMLDETDYPNGWIFQLIDLDKDDIPELTAIAVRGARGISAEVRVFAYRDFTIEELSVENNCSFSGLGSFAGYYNETTGETRWLMNLENFTQGGLAPGGYLESSGGQEGIAELKLSEDGSFAVIDPLVDVLRDWGITALYGIEATDREPWQEDCITEEIWGQIQQMAANYQFEVEPPELYVLYDGERSSEAREELYSEVEDFLAGY